MQQNQVTCNKAQILLSLKFEFVELKDDNFGRISLMDLLLQDETEEVQVRRIPNIHRASYITADRKGRNFASLQSLPNCRYELTYQLFASWVIFMLFCRLLIFFKISFFENFSLEYLQSVKQIGYRSGPTFCQA